MLLNKKTRRKEAADLKKLKNNSMNKTVEELAHDVYAICRDRKNNLKDCFLIISRDLIEDIEYQSNEQLETQVRKYRESYKKLSELTQLVFNLANSVKIGRLNNSNYLKGFVNV